MGLTTLPTLLLTLLAAVGSLAFTVRWWDRGRHPVVTRAVGLLVVQVLVTSAVGLQLNRTLDLYGSWSELFGVLPTATRATSARAGSMDATLLGRGRAALRSHHGLLVPWMFAGRAARLPARAGYVWLPPEYFDPAYAHADFPALELLTGFPGGPHLWLSPLDAPQVELAEVAAHRAVPTILVIPRVNDDPVTDRECVDAVPPGIADETYLTTDVRTDVLSAFRLGSSRRSWALMGYSTGGFCAVNLLLHHPDLYQAAVSVAGYFNAVTDATTGPLYGRDLARKRHNSPLWEVTHLPAPAADLFLTAGGDDTPAVREIRAFVPRVRPPLSVTALVLRHGGHEFHPWLLAEPLIFDWLAARLAPPLAAPLRVPAGEQLPLRLSTPSGGR